MFAGWLVEREVLEHNPVRDVKSSKPNGPRELYLERSDAISLVSALPAPYDAVAAFMANRMERQSVEGLRRKDIDLERLTVKAHGSKTSARNRTIRITELWALPIIRRHIAAVLPNAVVFEGVQMDTTLRVQMRTQKRLGIRAVGGKGEALVTLHDWRHFFAVASLRDGMKPQAVARNLGHTKTALVHKCYGKFIVDERDYITTGQRATN